MGVNSDNKERTCNEGFVYKSISLKLINGGPNKLRGLEKNQESNLWGDVDLASESTPIGQSNQAVSELSTRFLIRNLHVDHFIGNLHVDSRNVSGT